MKLTYNPETGQFFRPNGQEIKGTLDGGYLRATIKGKLVRLHRLAFELMEEELPDVVDHINGIRHDNRWCNLRACTHQQNSWNSESRGYYWCPKRNKFRARIRIAEGRKHLGDYKLEEDAKKVVADARDKYHGEFSVNRRKEFVDD